MVKWSEIQNLFPPGWKHWFSLLKALSPRNPAIHAIAVISPKRVHPKGRKWRNINCSYRTLCVLSYLRYLEATSGQQWRSVTWNRLSERAQIGGNRENDQILHSVTSQPEVTNRKFENAPRVIFWTYFIPSDQVSCQSKHYQLPNKQSS